MTTKRVPINRPTRARITPECVELWRRIQAGDDTARLPLHRLLGRRPWESFIDDIDGPEPPSWCNFRDAWRADWATRCELERMAA